jgi:ADP-ribosyl-[dinitrogen reductase] hydrolase
MPGIELAPRVVDGSDNKMGERFLAMMLGHAAGDVLGLPYELCRAKNQRLENYTGLPQPLRYHGRAGWKMTAPGQGSDDTEMALALLGTIVESSGDYVLTAAIKAYLTFAGASTFAGRNTRKLFGGIKTIKMYESRHAEQFPDGGDTREWSQGNGYLMRAYPLVLCSTAAIVADCKLTNPAPICVAWTLLYVQLLRLIVAMDPDRYDAQLIDERICAYARTFRDLGQDSDVFMSVLSPEIPTVTENKGWSRHAMHLAYLCATKDLPSFARGMELVIKLGGDTDTNGAICGAVLGARFGLKAMKAEATTSAVIAAIEECDLEQGNQPRPQELTMSYALRVLYPRIPAEAIKEPADQS